MGASRYEITVEAPAERVWDALSDFGRIWRMNAAVPSSHLTGDQATGVGATRHCDLVMAGASIEERIVDWRDGESYTVEIYDGARTPPFQSNAATLSVRPDGPDRSVLTTELVYELKFGPVGRLLDRTLVEPKFGPAFKLLAASIARHVETGDEITQQTDLSAELARVREQTAVPT